MRNQASRDYVVGIRFRIERVKKDLRFILEVLIMLTTKIGGNAKI